MRRPKSIRSTEGCKNTQNSNKIILDKHVLFAEIISDILSQKKYSNIDLLIKQDAEHINTAYVRNYNVN
jgi:hypothetical protein